MLVDKEPITSNDTLKEDGNTVYKQIMDTLREKPDLADHINRNGPVYAYCEKCDKRVITIAYEESTTCYTTSVAASIAGMLCCCAGCLPFCMLQYYHPCHKTIHSCPYCFRVLGKLEN